jgi:uncharacterized membrane protein
MLSRRLCALSATEYSYRMKLLSPSVLISEAWGIFKSRPWFFIGAAVVYFIIDIGWSFLSAVISGSETAGATPDVAAGIGMLIGMGVINFVVSAYLTTVALRFFIATYSDVRKVPVKELFSFNAVQVLWYMLATVLVGVCTLIGFLLLIVPGIIVALGLSMTTLLVINQGMGPIESMKESMRITKGYRGQIAVLSLALMALNLVGFLVVGVGLLVTIPLSGLVMIGAYSRLVHAAK